MYARGVYLRRLSCRRCRRWAEARVGPLDLFGAPFADGVRVLPKLLGAVVVARQSSNSSWGWELLGATADPRHAEFLLAGLRAEGWAETALLVRRRGAWDVVE